MKILLVSSKYPPEYSGSGHRSHWLYRRLTTKHPEIELRVICGSETENRIEEYEFEGAKVIRTACKPFPSTDSGGMAKRYQNARNFQAERQATMEAISKLGADFDLIHIFGENYVTASALDFARKNEIPTLIELCNEMDCPAQYVPFPFSMWISGDLPENSMFVCISERLKKVCLNHGASEEQVWCRPNPVDEKRFQPISDEKRCEIRKKLTKFAPQDKVISYVAKYIKRKNHIFLLDVIKNLPEEYKLFLGGPLVEKGPLRDDNQALFDDITTRINEEGLSERVEASHGFCDQVEEYYQMADVYAFPTKAEGLGTPMLESVACGTPVTANIIPGITDSWVKNGENGFLSELDPANFAAKVVEANAISKEKRLAAAEEMRQVAGTEAIDAGYFDRIMKLVLREK